MKTLLYILIVSLITVPPVFSQTAEQVRESQEIFTNAEKKLKKHPASYGAYQELMQKVMTLRPNHPGLLLNYANSLAINENYAEALNTLRMIAAMGVYYDISHMESFDVLQNFDAYQSILDQFDETLELHGSAELEFELKDKNLLIEGIAYQKEAGTFFLSSVHKKKILSFYPEEKRLISKKLTLSPLGLNLDSSGRFLWFTMSGLKQGKLTQNSNIGTGGIGCIDLENGEVVFEYRSKSDSSNQVFGDLITSENGMIYLTDSKGGRVYKFNREFKNLIPVTKKGDLISPQGLIHAQQNGELIITDYSIGLVKVDKREGEVSTIQNKTNTTLLGIDGIYRFQNDIIAIQNGIRPYRILRLILNQEETQVLDYKILLANHPYLDDPTLGTVVENKFYFNANSQWEKFKPDSNGKVNERKKPKILSINLQ